MKSFLWLPIAYFLIIQNVNGYAFYPYSPFYELTGRAFQTVGSSASSSPTGTFSNTYGNQFGGLPFSALNAALAGVRPIGSFLPRIVTSAEFTSLTNLVTSLQASVNQILNPRCTPDAVTIGAQLVDGQCLSVETVAKSYNDAKLKCFDQGGKLAEPSYNKYNFYRDLKSSFTSKINEIGNTPIYIGVSGTAQGNCSCNANNATTTVFTYNTNGFVVPSSTTIWLRPEIPGPGFANLTLGITQAAFIVAPATAIGPWSLDREPVLQTTSRPFICQYDVI